MSDYPVAEVLANMEAQANQGALCYVKYTCEGCQQRQTSDEANTWRQDGYICSECGHLTKPTMINFLLIHGDPEAIKKILADDLRK